MNKIAFVIPYFGKFNNYFPIFLKSCEKNKRCCDWLIFTDDKTEYNYPENVKVTYWTWEYMQDYINKKFPCEVEIKRPYKLCDYKPAYGYLFGEWLQGYTFWGHCDTDIIWGKIDNFLTSELLRQYDKIFDLGHCTIYRNTNQINSLFMNTLNGKARFLEVYGSDNNFSFDEEYKESINNIFMEFDIPMFIGSFVANIYTKSSDFLLTHMDPKTKKYFVEKKCKNFFVWENGALFRYRQTNNEIIKEEYMYIHMQSRKMKVNISLDQQIFKIIPNSFDTIECDKINMATFISIKKKHMNFHYFILRSNNLKIKLINRLKLIIKK